MDTNRENKGKGSLNGNGNGNGDRPDETSDRRDADGDGQPFSAIGESRRLVRSAQSAALATLAPDTGAPFASLVTIATDPGGAPILLLSDLAVHTTNIKADRRVSLLVEENHGHNPLAGIRVTMTGIIGKAGDLDLTPDLATVRRRFLAKHPDAGFYSGFTDFAFYAIEPETIHLVAGFGRIVDIAAQDFLIDCRECADLLAAEEDAIAHMNADHPDAIGLYATKLAGAPDGQWRITGLDPEGLDLRSQSDTCRVLFPEPVRGPGPLRAQLKQMADFARSSTT